MKHRIPPLLWLHRRVNELLDEDRADLQRMPASAIASELSAQGLSPEDVARAVASLQSDAPPHNQLSIGSDAFDLVGSGARNEFVVHFATEPQLHRFLDRLVDPSES